MPETPEEQIRKLIIESSESGVNIPGYLSDIPIQDFTPYLLIKILEHLEVIEASLDSINSSMSDFWNSKYNE